MLRAENSTEHQRTIFGPVFLYERAGFCTKNSKYFCHNSWPSINNCALGGRTEFQIWQVLKVQPGSKQTNKTVTPSCMTVASICRNCSSLPHVSRACKEIRLPRIKDSTCLVGCAIACCCSIVSLLSSWLLCPAGWPVEWADWQTGILAALPPPNSPSPSNPSSGGGDGAGRAVGLVGLMDFWSSVV